MKAFSAGPADQQMAEQLGPRLAEAFPDWDWSQARLSPHPIQGYKSRIFNLCLGPGLDLIAKVRPADVDAQRFSRERDVLNWLTDRAMACPRPRGLGLIPGQPAYQVLLLDRVQGQLLAESGQADAYASLGRYLGKLNRLMPPYPAGLTQIEARGLQQWATHSVENLSQLDFFDRREIGQLEVRLKPLEQPVLEKALERPCLLHNDPNAFNVILGPTGETAAVLDWESSLLGPPEYQVATMLAYLSHPGHAINREQIQQRQLNFVRGYGRNIDELVSALQLVRLLGTLSLYCTPANYDKGAYRSAYRQDALVNREDYDQRVLWQCEAALREILAGQKLL